MHPLRLRPSSSDHALRARCLRCYYSSSFLAGAAPRRSRHSTTICYRPLADGTRETDCNDPQRHRDSDRAARRLVGARLRGRHLRGAPRLLPDAPDRAPRVGRRGRAHARPWIGAVNTFVLLTSSFTAVLGHQAAEKGDGKTAAKYLAPHDGWGADLPRDQGVRVVRTRSRTATPSPRTPSGRSTTPRPGCTPCT